MLKINKISTLGLINQPNVPYVTAPIASGKNNRSLPDTGDQSLTSEVFDLVGIILLAGATTIGVQRLKNRKI